MPETYRITGRLSAAESAERMAPSREPDDLLGRGKTEAPFTVVAGAGGERVVRSPVNRAS